MHTHYATILKKGGHMTIEVKTITTPFIFNASINCFLVKASNEFILIDTGRSNKRKTIEKELENSNCHPGNLKLIILTHGDFDHSQRHHN